MPSGLLLLDTHCWLWAQLGLVRRLSQAALKAIQNAESEGGLRVSVISVWELAMLEKRGSATVRQRSSVLGDREARAARSSPRPPDPEPPPKQVDLVNEDDEGGEEE